MADNGKRVVFARNNPFEKHGNKLYPTHISVFRQIPFEAAGGRTSVRYSNVRAYGEYPRGFSSVRLYYIGAGQGPDKQTIGKKKKQEKYHKTILR